MAFAWRRDLKIYIYYGPKGQGKSYFCSRMAVLIIATYRRNEERYPGLQKRQFWSSQKFSPEYEAQELYDEKKNPDGRLHYWSHPSQLYLLKNVDILWDEIGKDLPAGSFATTPRKLKQVFSHLRKRGNRLFANTQIYEDIDVSFRRQVDFAFELKKLCGSKDVSASMPAPKHIWGVMRVRAFDPLFLEHQRDPEKRDMYHEGIGRFYFLRRKFVELYDTHSEIPPYHPDKFYEEIITCIEGEKCANYDQKTHQPHTRINHVAF